MNASYKVALVLLALILFTTPEVAYAYGGPGSVISGIGAFLAAIAAVVVALFGFLWYPLKRAYKRVYKGVTASKEETVEAAESQSSE